VTATTATIDIAELKEKVWPSLSDPEKLALVCHNLAATTIRESGEPLAPADVSVEVRRLVYDREDGYQLQTVGTYTGQPTKKNRRPAQLDRSLEKLDPEAFFVSFFQMEKGGPWEKANDLIVYRMLLKWAQGCATLQPGTAAQMSKAVSMALAYRCGLDVEGWTLEQAR
jgi:hypothetical protein